MFCNSETPVTDTPIPYDYRQLTRQTPLGKEDRPYPIPHRGLPLSAAILFAPRNTNIPHVSCSSLSADPFCDYVLENER